MEWLTEHLHCWRLDTAVLYRWVIAGLTGMFWLTSFSACSAWNRTSNSWEMRV